MTNKIQSDKIKENQVINKRHKKFLSEAINEALISIKEGGIPIGSVLVKNNKIVSRGHNRRIQDGNPMMHAEIDCLLKATKKIMNLKGYTLYSTHMPCCMCAGTAIQFGISEVIAGENKTFPGAKGILQQAGINVICLKDINCEKILTDFINKHPEHWEKTSIMNTHLKNI